MFLGGKTIKEKPPPGTMSSCSHAITTPLRSQLSDPTLPHSLPSTMTLLPLPVFLLTSCPFWCIPFLCHHTCFSPRPCSPPVNRVLNKDPLVSPCSLCPSFPVRDQWETAAIKLGMFVLFNFLFSQIWARSCFVGLINHVIHCGAEFMSHQWSDKDPDLRMLVDFSLPHQEAALREWLTAALFPFREWLLFGCTIVFLFYCSPLVLPTYSFAYFGRRELNNCKTKVVFWGIGADFLKVKTGTKGAETTLIQLLWYHNNRSLSHIWYITKWNSILCSQVWSWHSQFPSFLYR